MTVVPDPCACDWRLCPLVPDDLALYVALYTDAAVMRHIAPPRSPRAAAADFRAALALPAGPLGEGRQRRVLRLGEGRGIGLLAVDPVGDVLELGLMLLPQDQGRGLGRRIVARVLRELALRAAGKAVQVQYQSGNCAMAALAQTFAPDAPRAGPGSERLTQRLCADAVPHFILRRSRCPCS